MSPSPSPSPSSSVEAAPEHEALSTARRLRRLRSHLTPAAPPPSPGRADDRLEMLTCARAKKIDFDTEKLSGYMRGKHRGIQEQVYEYFNSRPDLQTPVEISMDEHRELCMRQLLGLVREAGIRPFRFVSEDPEKYFAIVEAVGSVDMSLGIKMGVQYRCDLVELVFRFSTSDFEFRLAV